MPEITKQDLSIFCFKKGKTYYKDFSSFCNNNPQSSAPAKLSRQTMTNYLKELKRDGYLKRELTPGDKYPHYYVPENRHYEIRELEEKRRIDLEFKELPPKDQMEIIKKSICEKNKEKVFTTLTFEGPFRISQIAAKTELSEKRVYEAIWGEAEGINSSLPLIGRRVVTTDKNYTMPAMFRLYSLSFVGLYFALKKYPENLDRIAEKWGNLHPFVFERLQLFKNYGLEEVLKEFFKELDPINFRLEEDKAIKEVEDRLIDFIPRRGEYVFNWFKFLHDDRQFRDRVKIRYSERIDSCKQGIRIHERALKTVDKLASSKPNWEEIKWEISFFVCLM